MCAAVHCGTGCRCVKIANGVTAQRSQADFMALTSPKTVAKAAEKFPRTEVLPRPFPKRKKE